MLSNALRNIFQMRDLIHDRTHSSVTNGENDNKSLAPDKFSQVQESARLIGLLFQQMASGNFVNTLIREDPTDLKNFEIDPNNIHFEECSGGSGSDEKEDYEGSEIHSTKSLKAKNVIQTSTQGYGEQKSESNVPVIHHEEILESADFLDENIEKDINSEASYLDDQFILISSDEDKEVFSESEDCTADFSYAQPLTFSSNKAVK